MIRENYKLFIINYGNYLEANKMYDKEFGNSDKLITDGILFPEMDPRILSNPEEFTVKLPVNVEKQYCCPKCSSIVILENDFKCPNCNNQLMPYSSLDLFERKAKKLKADNIQVSSM